MILMALFRRACPHPYPYSRSQQSLLLLQGCRAAEFFPLWEQIEIQEAVWRPLVNSSRIFISLPVLIQSFSCDLTPISDTGAVLLSLLLKRMKMTLTTPLLPLTHVSPCVSVRFCLPVSIGILP